MADRVSWVGSPNTRRTMDVLWSCISTLGLCVWTAVHPNIQLYPGSGRSLRVRILLMSTAVVFPEIIISAALRQRKLASAKNITLDERITQKGSDHQCSTAETSGASRAEVTQTALSGVSQRRTATMMNEDGQSFSRYDTAQGEPGATNHTKVTTQRSGSATVREMAHTQNMAETPKNEKSVFHNNDKNMSSIDRADLPALTKWGREQLYFIVMGGLTVDFGGQGKYFLTVHALPFLEKAGCLPDLSVEDVKERSNADVITKLIVVVQTVWFAVQIVARLASRLTVTALEVHTIVHVGCAIVMYGLWWDKPYNVSRSIEIRDEETKNLAAVFVYKQWLDEHYEEAVQRYERADREYWRRGVFESAAPTPPLRQKVTQVLGDLRCSNDDEYRRTDVESSAKKGLNMLVEKDREITTLLDRPFDGVRISSENFSALSIWGSWTEDHGHEWSFDKMMHIFFNLLYGAGHLAAWSSTTFPTQTERWLWRTASLMLVSVPIWGMIWMLFWKAARSHTKLLKPIQSGELNMVIGPFFCLVMICYILARCLFLVEALISLRSLPTSAYELVQWTYYLPHAS